MMIDAPNINCLWAALMVDELVRLGVGLFVICPGSRSSVLALAAANHPRAVTLTHFDERGGAFYALACGAGSGSPAAIISTSGTAAANFLPAVVESSRKKVPLILLTADRPPELRHTGADQTIEQPGLMGSYVRFEFDLPCPTTAIPAAMVLTTIDQAVYRARHPLPGPVHLNCMFREPLAPVSDGRDLAGYTAGLDRWKNGVRPYTIIAAPETRLSVAAAVGAAKVLNAARQGIIVVGKLRSDHERAAVLVLADKLQWPVFPDVSSGLRLSPSRGPVVHYFDQLLLNQHLASDLAPDCVLQLGGRMTSKRLNQFIETVRPKEYIMVLPHALRHDPGHQVTLRIESPVASFCAGVTGPVRRRRPGARLERLLKLSGAVGRKLDRLAAAGLSEPSVIRHVSVHILSGQALFIGNSMPVRDMDMYGATRARDILIGTNRGASGIDGLMASACGFARGSGRPLTLVIGDVSLLHDLNSLALVASAAKPVTIVVLNNNGGGIFSFLPVGQFKPGFERCFAAPHGLSFKAAADMFGLAYARPATLKAFAAAYARAVGGVRHTIIEVMSDRDGNFRLHQEWQEAVRRIIDQPITRGL
jgi:2-succinyl-5-enolpyruvyl-6-hydroxy-3-cyclohexene-1-carboxylate synthase